MADSINSLALHFENVGCCKRHVNFGDDGESLTKVNTSIKHIGRSKYRFQHPFDALSGLKDWSMYLLASKLQLF